VQGRDRHRQLRGQVRRHHSSVSRCCPSVTLRGSGPVRTPRSRRKRLRIASVNRDERFGGWKASALSVVAISPSVLRSLRRCRVTPRALHSGVTHWLAPFGREQPAEPRVSESAVRSVPAAASAASASKVSPTALGSVVPPDRSQGAGGDGCGHSEPPCSCGSGESLPSARSRHQRASRNNAEASTLTSSGELIKARA
jgi:hypothetical protein